MTEYDVAAGAAGPFVIGASGVESVLQNVRVILSTLKGSVPLDREFGMEATFLDAPQPAAMARASSEIVTAIAKWEPRARVTRVDWTSRGDAAGPVMDGRLFPKVRIAINAL